MALTVNTGYPNNSASVDNYYSAGLTSDAGAAADTYVNFGFKPRYIKLVNITDLATDEFFDGMPSGNSLHEITAGTKSLVASAFVVDNWGVTIKAGTIPASKSFYILAFA